MKMPASFYMQIFSLWQGTPNEKAAKWDKDYNDVSPPPLSSLNFLTDQDLANHLAEYCDHEW